MNWWRVHNDEVTDEFVAVNGGLIMTRVEWERTNAPWWKRIFMRK